MPILRLAYVALFLLALIAVFVLWSQAAGQVHLDLLPWYLKVGLGLSAAYCTVKAAIAAVEGKRAWNAYTLRWVVLLALILIGCGIASYYAHLYGEEDSPDEDNDSDGVVGRLFVPPPPPPASGLRV